MATKMTLVKLGKFNRKTMFESELSEGVGADRGGREIRRCGYSARTHFNACMKLSMSKYNKS